MVVASVVVAIVFGGAEASSLGTIEDALAASMITVRVEVELRPVWRGLGECGLVAASDRVESGCRLILPFDVRVHDVALREPCFSPPSSQTRSPANHWS